MPEQSWADSHEVDEGASELELEGALAAVPPGLPPILGTSMELRRSGDSCREWAPATAQHRSPERAGPKNNLDADFVRWRSQNWERLQANRTGRGETPPPRFRPAAFIHDYPAEERKGLDLEDGQSDDVPSSPREGAKSGDWSRRVLRPAVAQRTGISSSASGKRARGSGLKRATDVNRGATVELKVARIHEEAPTQL